MAHNLVIELNKLIKSTKFEYQLNIEVCPHWPPIYKLCLKQLISHLESKELIVEQVIQSNYLEGWPFGLGIFANRLGISFFSSKFFHNSYKLRICRVISNILSKSVFSSANHCL